MAVQMNTNTFVDLMGPDKVFPHNSEAEQAVLGAILLDNQVLDEVIEILDVESFYLTKHQDIYSAILSLYERNSPIDIITLSDELTRRGKLDSIGGPWYLTTLVENVSTTRHVVEHAKIVKDKAILRKLILTAGEIIKKSFSNEKDATAVLEYAEKLIFDLAKKKEHSDFVSVKNLLPETFSILEKIHHGKAKVTGIPTGFTKFDELTCGFQPADLIIIAGRPSMGKTAFCLSVAQYIAIEKRIPIAFFSLEMTKQQVVQRMLCSLARVDLQTVRSGIFPDKKWLDLSVAAAKLAEAEIYLDDTPAIPILELRAKARRLKTKVPNLGVIFIDYLQLMHSQRSRGETRQQEIAEICGALKALARELQIPVVAISQLSRAPETRRETKRPQLSDLRESGAIEQDADLVAFIYRESYYRDMRLGMRASQIKEDIAEIIIGKQRNGPTGVVKLAFIREYTKFENLAYDSVSPFVSEQEEI